MSVCRGRDCRAPFPGGRHGAAGPWLFGAYSAADAMFAPVVLRFLSYGLQAIGPARDYLDTVLADAALQDWMNDAEAEGVTVAADETGIPA